MRKIYLILFTLLFCAWRPVGINDKPQPLFPQDDARARSGFVYADGAQFKLGGEIYRFKGVNYFPSKNSWRMMWESWDPHAVNAELALLENLGVNTVRIFLDYNLFEKHRVYGDYSIMLARLDELLGICDAHGMKALVTPFVWGRKSAAHDKLHIRHIVERFKNDPRIFGWDVSNELDHGWADSPKNLAEVQEWADAIFNEIKEIDKNHLVTVGDYGHYLGDRSDPYGSKLTLDISKMSVSIMKQDFVCFHWYEHFYALTVALDKLRLATGKPIVVEEIGLPSGGTQDGKAWHLDENQVALYYTGWMTAAAEAGAYLMPWCGFDYVPALSPYGKDSIQNYFGLYAADYRLKPAGEVFRDFILSDTRKIMKLLHGLPPVERIERPLANFTNINEGKKGVYSHVDR